MYLLFLYLTELLRQYKALKFNLFYFVQTTH